MYLSKYARMAEKHWKEHRPRMYEKLKKSGKLYQALMEADNLTTEAIGELIEKGVDFYQAQEMILPEWILLPDEEDVPELGENQNPENLL